MNVADMLNALNASRKLPVAALRAAEAQPERVLPVFLREIDAYIAGGAGSRERTAALFFIFHLLGSWRAKSAYRPLASLLRLDPDEVDHILGDGITTSAHRVIAAVFDGDPAPLYEIILDPLSVTTWASA